MRGTSPATAAPRVVGVARIADYLKRRIEADSNLRDVAVKGEVSNLSVSAKGYFNFDLKEGDAILRCFAWGDDAARFPKFGNGTAIVARGSVTTYRAKSSYQLQVRSIEGAGLGDVHVLFEERKRKLTAEGLFDASRKRTPPAFPFRVALVSSRGANGALDFTTILRERAPHVEVVWCETTVQGPNAPNEIVAALGRASRADVDAIVLTRGGGSFEDLFAFSDEGVVRAVARARHPVISAIGHTADQQLCDFAADVHLETPSAAAKAIGSDARELRTRIAERLERARRSVSLRVERLEGRLSACLVRSRLSQPRLFLAPLAQRLDDVDAALASAATAAARARGERIDALRRRLEARDPSRRLAERSRALQGATLRLHAAFDARVATAQRRRDAIDGRLANAIRARTERFARRIDVSTAHLLGKDPEAILQRGYAIVEYDEAIVRDPAAVPAGAMIVARVARGTLTARVESTASKETDGNQRDG